MTKKSLKNIILPIALVFYSLMLANQGITVTDTGYNYGNFVNFESLDNMWKFSTYLATVLGNLFTYLPFGQSMLGLNIYTGLVKASVALIVYYVCIYCFNMKYSIVFLAELMALGYCWCPTALLYNYLTYLLFTLSAVLLCVAVKSKKRFWYVLAGMCLGMNVLVRLPNLAEAALILAVWFYCYISKCKVKDTIIITGLCFGGYILGFGIILFYIFYKYGIEAYVQGIYELLTMPNEANSYSLRAMISGDIFCYRDNMKWLIIALVLVLVGTVFFFVFKRKKNMLKKTIYICCNVLLLAVYKKMGMFKLTYYNYDSIERVGIFFLILAGILGLYVMFFGGTEYSLRMHAATMGIIILITPLGSNNYLFSAINNLFWATPFIFHCCYEWSVYSKCKNAKNDVFREPLRITFTFLILFSFFQGVVFGMNFVFRDGTNGEERTERITDIPTLANIYTQPQNAEALSGLNTYLVEHGLKDKEVILYNDVPGLAFYMELEPALSSTWPDLDSFSNVKFQYELQEISKALVDSSKPIIILGEKLDVSIVKDQILQTFMTEMDYELIYFNDLCYLYW